jgi:hypothetical protein
LGEGVTPDYPPYNDAIFASTNNTSSGFVHGASPGTGAISYDLGRDFYATRNLKPGEEIVSIILSALH